MPWQKIINIEIKPVEPFGRLWAGGTGVA